MKTYNNFFVLTGGPGAGKTTLQNSLHKLGYKTMTEAGRTIIQQETLKQGNAHSHKDPLIFAQAMIKWDLQNYKQAQNIKDTVFFDRGLPDTLGYLKLMNLPVSADIQNTVINHRYNHIVFLAPFWEDIYHQDDERKQSADEAQKTALIMEQTYQSLGYKVVSLPKSPLKQRVSFIINEIKKSNREQ